MPKTEDGLSVLRTDANEINWKDMHKTEALVNVISITVKKNIKKSWSRETPEEELFLCVLCAKQNLRRE